MIYSGSHWPRVLTLALCCGLSATAQALDISAIVGYSAEYNDNPLRLPTGGESEIIHRPLVNLSVGHDDRNLSADANYRTYRRIHSKSDGRDDTVVEGTGSLNWVSSRDVLELQVSNTETVRTLSAQENDGPDNRQQVSRSTGSATLRLPGFANQYFTLASAASVIDAERSNTNSTRYIQDLRYNIPLINEGVFSIGIGHTDVDFDNQSVPDYTQETASVLLTSSRGSISYSVNFALTEVDLEGPLDTLDLETGSIDLAWARSADTSISFRVSRSVSDNSLGREFRTTGENFRDEFIDNSSTNALFIEERAAVTLQTRVGRNQVAFQVAAYDTDYVEFDVNDEERLSLSLNVSRELTGRLRMGFRAAYADLDFLAIDRVDTDTDVDVNFKYTSNPKLEFGLSLGYFERNSDLFSIPDIDGYSAIFSVNYRLLGRG